MTSRRNTARDRLIATGYTYISGWLPDDLAKQVLRLVKDHKRLVERIRDEERLRGNPNWRGDDR